MQIPDRFLQTPQKQITNYQIDLLLTSSPILSSKLIQCVSQQFVQGSDIVIQPEQQISHSFTFEQNFKILVQGQIDKKTLNSNYQQRYFVLTNTRLMYYQDQNKSILKGCFNLVSLLKYQLELVFQYPQISVKVNPKDYQQLFNNRSIIQLQFKDKMQASKWFNELDKVIKDLSVRNYLSSPKLCSFFPQISIEQLLQMNQKISNQYNSNFWNRLDISIYELSQYSSHLDILLMRSKHPASYFSRFFMRSYYDHVALIVKSQLHQTFVFQATQARGVSIMDLDTFLEINNQTYEEVAIRKLIVQHSQSHNFDNHEEFYKGINIQNLQNYLNSLLGKKYQLSLFKLFVDRTDSDPSCKKSSTGKKSNFYVQNTVQNARQQNQNDNFNYQYGVNKQPKSFFCSQLIADVYLKFKILKSGKSKDFWPKDFQQNNMNFKENCYLSPIMNVCLK